MNALGGIFVLPLTTFPKTTFLELKCHGSYFGIAPLQYCHEKLDAHTVHITGFRRSALRLDPAIRLARTCRAHTSRPSRVRSLT